MAEFFIIRTKKDKYLGIINDVYVEDCEVVKKYALVSGMFIYKFLNEHMLVFPNEKIAKEVAETLSHWEEIEKINIPLTAYGFDKVRINSALYLFNRLQYS